MENIVDWKKYVLVFIITCLIFGGAIWLSDFFGNKKIDTLNKIQDQISIDILSSETQFALLEELSCADINKSILSQELNDLATKIEYSEKNIGTDNSEIVSLKRYYSLLEIKDYLLMKKISQRCGQKSIFVLYFYTTKDNCSECVRQGFILTALREKYPGLRVYSFDYSLDLSAVKALISIYNIEDTKLPALVINRELFTGYHSVEDIEKAFPQLKTLNVVEPTAEKTKDTKD
ncbi:MAG: hypothetical protein WC795_03190 [Candidatus Paceibacterota bacterium]|jgi:hypothetical protein